MSSIRPDRVSHVDVEASRILLDEPRISSTGARKAVELLSVALTAALLAGCARSTVVTHDSASLASSRQASLESNRNASFVTSRRVAVVTRKHSPFATKARAPATREASHGIASFYTEGTQTANGEKFDSSELTAAHRTLPFGTRVRVTNVVTGRSVTVRINDRGPFVPGRIVDVSHFAAKTLGITEQGIAKVKLDVVR